MSNEIKRMNYFNGLLLKEDDLALEQDYHMKLQRLHNRFFHEWGIVDGLKVVEVPNCPQITVSQGLALNRIKDEKTNQMLSQEIWVCDNHPESLQNLELYDIDQNIYITVSYKEVLADIDNNKGGNIAIHTWERSIITNSPKMPDDPTVDIVIACVRLTKDVNGNKVINTILDYIEEKEINSKGETEIKKVQVCNYAVTQGTAKEFQKVSIGEKDKLYLPYISGLIDKSLGKNDGLEVHSPYTKFTGTLLSGDLTANGTIEANSALKVKANDKEVFNVNSKGSVYIANTASVGGTLSSAGGLIVRGDNTTLDTTNVVMTGNILSINSYTPEANETEPRKQSSGIEVYRGGTLPNAKFVWDENEKVWKAGTEKSGDSQEGGFYNVAYGAAWDIMQGGSNADKYHMHSNICDDEGKTVLSVDTSGNVGITNSVTVAGNIVAKNGIAAPSENTTAKLGWNENDKHWQIGTENETESKMFNIPYGEDWEALTSGTNADILHTHSEFYGGNGQVAMSAGPDGNVEINSNLAVAKDLTVDGNLTVLGTTTEFKKMPQVVTENVVIVNKPENGEQPITEGGLEVYRGSNIPNARLIWDEGCDSWKIGVGSSMSEIPSGIDWEHLTHGDFADGLHKHNSLYKDDDTVVISVDKNGNIDADGGVAIDGTLSVAEDAQIKGELTVDGSLTLKGDLNIMGTETVINKKTVEVDDSVIIVNRYTGQSNPLENEGGLEVYRGGMTPNARIVWNELEKKWKVGTGVDMSDLPSGEKWDELTQKALADGLHLHSKLCDKDGNSILGVNSDGDISIEKDTKVNGTLSVEGSMTVTGDLKVTNLEYISQKDLQIENNVILLNKYEGDASQIYESGIEIYRGSTEAKARLMWDEVLKIWKIGIGDQLTEIACGSAWDKLTKKQNTDALHFHGQLYNEKGEVLALSTRSSGNVDVTHDLLVGQDLTILGNLNVAGGLTRIDSNNIEILGNSIVINKFDFGELPQVESGLTVFRGNDEKNAIIVWDEVNDYWKIGLTDKFLKIESDGSIKAPAVNIEGELSAVRANILGTLIVQKGIEVNRDPEKKAIIEWDSEYDLWKIGTGEYVGISVTADGKVGIGNVSPQKPLDVNGNAIVSGDMEIGQNIEVAGSSVLTGKLTAGSAEILGSAEVKGSLNVTGNIAMNGNIEVLRGKDTNGVMLPPAKIEWDEQNSVWTFGFGDKMDKLILNGDHNHSQFYTHDGNALAISISTDKDANGYIGIGTDSPNAKLEVNGDTLIDGKLTAKSSFEIFRGATKESAKLYWNEDTKVWQAGYESRLKDIALSDHRHSNLYTSSGAAAINVDSNGNVAVGKDKPDAKLDIAGNLKATSVNVLGALSTGGAIKGANAQITGNLQTESAEVTTDLTVGGSIKTGSAEITQDLTVGGNLTVKGEVVTVNTTTLDVEDNIITINKYAPQATPADKNGGLEVFRGGTNPNAQIIWNEKDDMWQAGTDGDLKNLSFSDHEHTELTNIMGTMTVNAGNIGIGTTTPVTKLDVNGSVKVSGNISAVGADLSGDISAVGANLSGNISAVGANLSGNISAVGAELSGNLNAVDIGLSGDISAVGANLSGNISAVGAELSGNLNAVDIGLSGDISAVGANLSGNLNAVDIVLSGDLNAVNVDISGNLTVKQGIAISGDVSANNITTMQTTIKTMQTTIANLQTTIATMQADIIALQV